MPKRWHMIVFAVSTLAAILYVTVSRPREPCYNGRPLSEWIERHGESDSPADQEEAAAAIRRIGTNALPHLMAWIRERPMPAWKMRLGKAAEALPRTLQPEWLERGNPRPRLAVSGLVILGPTAKTAIPELTRLANEIDDNQTAFMAAEALARLGKEGFPSLVALLTNANQVVRSYAAVLLPYQASNASPAIPMLLQQLSNGIDNMVARAAAKCLGIMALEPRLVVPALSNALYTADPPMRLVIVEALGRFAEEGKLAGPAAAIALTDQDPHVRAAARKVLLNIAPELLTNAPSK